jgi:hypothetical protein
VRNAGGTTERDRYASALAGLWGNLGATLARLEAIAADPALRLRDEAPDVLPALQYALHRAGELCIGIDPPVGAEGAHAELATALEEARDATGEVVELVELEGPEAVALLVHEWRGALFRVRLARHRLAAVPRVELPAEPEEEDGDLTRRAATSTLLVLAGTVAFTAGAVLALWPLWALGLGLVAVGFLVFRP